MKERGAGVREVALAIGSSISTVSRITQGKGFEAKWIIPIAVWCDLGKYDDAEQLWELLEVAP